MDEVMWGMAGTHTLRHNPNKPRRIKIYADPHIVWRPDLEGAPDEAGDDGGVASALNAHVSNATRQVFLFILNGPAWMPKDDRSRERSTREPREDGGRERGGRGGEGGPSSAKGGPSPITSSFAHDLLGFAFAA